MNPEKGGASQIFEITDRKAAAKVLKTQGFSSSDVEEAFKVITSINVSEKITAANFGPKGQPGISATVVFGARGDTYVNPSVPRPKVSETRLGHPPDIAIDSKMEKIAPVCLETPPTILPEATLMAFSPAADVMRTCPHD